MQEVEVAIIGAGISGLSAAYYLHKRGKSVQVFEKNAKVGGALSSEKVGDYFLERGANTVAMNVELQELVEELGLKKSLDFPHTHSHNRFIYRNQELYKLTQSPLSLFRSGLLSRGAKFRLAKEPFISSVSSGQESVAEFFTRRIGQEAYEFLVAAGLQGVYAGIPEQMSMEAVMPALLEMEAEKGSLLKGLIARQKAAKKSGAPKRSIFAIKGGMGKLCENIADQLGEKLLLNTPIQEIRKVDTGYEIQTADASYSAQELIYAAPAHAANMLQEMAPGLAGELLRIPYAPMLLLHLAYEKVHIGRSCEGFGFLIPPKEDKALLGAIWNSAIFKGRAKSGQMLFTLFVGGARYPDFDPTTSRAHIHQAQQEFEEIMQIDAAPTFVDNSFWKQAIPQFGMKHMEILDRVKAEQAKYPGFHLVGNFLQGVSVGDCVKRAKELVAGM